MKFSSIFVFMLIHLYGHNSNIWEIPEFIWSAGAYYSCDIKLQKSPKSFFADPIQFDPSIYQKIKDGDIVWLPCRHLHHFANQILPTLSSSCVLLINDPRDGDDTFPPSDFDIETFLRHPLILHVFAQNCAYQGNSQKVSHFPIGIDFHTIAYKGDYGGWGEIGSPLEQQQILHQIIASSKPTTKRKKRIFVDFHHSGAPHRKLIFDQLLNTNLIDHTVWMNRHYLWRKKSSYAFSISPHGNGLDCHRTWEDLALGCIVIVKTSPLDPLYEGLPVVIINDWNEITPEHLETWLLQFGDVLHNPKYRERLTHLYWYHKLHIPATSSPR